MEIDYPEPELKYTLVDLLLSSNPDTGDLYPGFDRFGRVKDSRWRNYGSSVDADRIRYGYDRAGNRLWRENLVADSHGGGCDELYTYDGLHRLANLQRGDLSSTKDAILSQAFAEAWTLDPTGNWSGFQQDADGDAVWDLEQTRTANAVNELTGISATAGLSWAVPVYDRAGNMTSIPQPADPTHSFAATWDAWNRLVQLEDGASTVATYAYDGRNFRVTKSISGTTRHYYYNSGWQVLEERLNSASSAERQFVWGQRHIDELVLRDRDTAANGTLDERLYSLHDGNWNVTTLCDETGSVQERYGYSAYGRPTVLETSFAGRSASFCDWETRYAGYRWDAESEMQHVQNRYLQPVLGKFTGRDPLSYEAGINMYAYAWNNPLSYIDAAGLRAIAPPVAPPAPPAWPPTPQPTNPMPKPPVTPEPGVTGWCLKKLCTSLGAIFIVLTDPSECADAEWHPQWDPPLPPDFKRKIRQCRCTIRHMRDPERKKHGCPDRVYGYGKTLGECQRDAKSTAPEPCRKYYAHCGFTHAGGH